MNLTSNTYQSSSNSHQSIIMVDTSVNETMNLIQTDDSSFHRTFKQFLESKKETGFGVRDYLQSRYIDYVDSKTFPSKAVNFLLLGGLGYLFTDTNYQNGKLLNYDDLKRETEFYRACTKAQKLFNKFCGKPADHYEQASEAFEELHNFIVNLKDLDKTQAHQLINEVLNKQMGGTNVARALLEHFARAELTKNGGFSGTNLQAFYLNYKETLLTKEQQGYGTVGIGQNGNISKEPNSACRAFAHVLGRILKEQPTNKSKDIPDDVHYRIFNDTADALLSEDVSDSLVDHLVGRYNQELLEAVQFGKTCPSLFHLVEQREQETLVALYKDYNSYQAKKGALEFEIGSVNEELAQLTQSLNSYKEKGFPCSSTMLYPLLNGLEQLPSGFEEYSTLLMEVNEHEKNVNDLRAKIEGAEEDKKGGKVYLTGNSKADVVLNSFNQKISELQTTIEQAQQAIKEQQVEVEEAHRNLQTSKRPPKIYFNFSGKIDQEDLQSLVEFNAKNTEYQKQTEALKELQTQLKQYQDQLNNFKVVKGKILQSYIDSYQTQLKIEVGALSAAKEKAISVRYEDIYAARDIVQTNTELKSIVENIEEGNKKVATLTARHQQLQEQLKQLGEDNKDTIQPLDSLIFKTTNGEFGGNAIRDGIKAEVRANRKLAYNLLLSDKYDSMDSKIKANIRAFLHAENTTQGVAMPLLDNSSVVQVFDLS